MDVLRHEVILQSATRSALPAIAAQASQQGNFRLIQRGHKLAIGYRQVIQRSLAFIFNIRIEQA